MYSCKLKEMIYIMGFTIRNVILNYTKMLKVFEQSCNPIYFVYKSYSRRSRLSWPLKTIIFEDTCIITYTEIFFSDKKLVRR